MERRRFISGADIVPPSRYAIDFSKSKDLTVQSGKDDADINVIVKRFGLTGQVKAANVMPFYGDFSGVEDYHSAMNMLVEAKQSFMQLPAEVRDRFGNDPGKLIAFLGNPENRDEARKLGLLKPQEAAPAPLEVKVVNPEPPPASSSSEAAKP